MKGAASGTPGSHLQLAMHAMGVRNRPSVSNSPDPRTLQQSRSLCQTSASSPAAGISDHRYGAMHPDKPESEGKPRAKGDASPLLEAPGNSNIKQPSPRRQKQDQRQRRPIKPSARSREQLGVTQAQALRSISTKINLANDCQHQKTSTCADKVRGDCNVGLQVGDCDPCPNQGQTEHIRDPVLTQIYHRDSNKDCRQSKRHCDQHRTGQSRRQGRSQHQTDRRLTFFKEFPGLLKLTPMA